jgi:hypothetical protein
MTRGWLRRGQRSTFLTLVLPTLALDCGGSSTSQPAVHTVDPALAAQGKDIFRIDTFGDETVWTDMLQLNTVVGTAVDPTTALSVGLKVDSDALSADVVQGIQDGSISLTSPDTTVALLKLNAVVGLVGKVDTVGGKDTLTSLGVTCAICHSTVDDSFTKGIGKRLDGWPNHDLVLQASKHACNHAVAPLLAEGKSQSS